MSHPNYAERLTQQFAEQVSPPALAAGQRARKVGGSYQATGTVVATFATLADELRYVFEFDTPAGMLHIFGPSQLAALDAGDNMPSTVSQPTL